MSWQEHRANPSRILMFLTTSPWWKWLKLLVHMAPVPHAKDGALQPVLGHATGQKHHVHAQEHDHGQTTSNRHSAAGVTADTGGQSALLLLPLLLIKISVAIFQATVFSPMWGESEWSGSKCILISQNRFFLKSHAYHVCLIFFAADRGSLVAGVQWMSPSWSTTKFNWLVRSLHRHGWCFMRFEAPESKLWTTLKCPTLFAALAQ